MKRSTIALSLCLLLMCCMAALVSNAVAESRGDSDQVKIAKLVQELDSMTPARLQELKPIQVKRFELPDPGVHVMRARLSETYSVDGVGRDTVELSGWIAVRHSAPYLSEGATELNWNTAVLDTEFVGMDLKGRSQIFGDVQVTLDPSRKSLGQVGNIKLPELARVALMGKLDKDMALYAANAATTTTTKTTATDAPEAGSCVAPAYASISMPDLGLKMTTKSHVYWYSLVDTIPPVGHTASIAIEPVRLISEGREVATLESGIVKFREVVRDVPLDDNARVAVK